MISIIIPLYNKESCIRKTIDSVLSQDFENFEIVVVDDGSIDSSCSIVESYQDNRIKLYKKSNGGPASARNYGVTKAKGEWIVFLDADDYFLPGALILFHNMQKENSEYKCFCCNYLLEKDGILSLRTYLMPNGVCRNPFKKWLTRQFSPRTGAAMISKDVLLDHPFDERLRRYEDAQSSFEIIREYKFYCCNKPVMVYNCDMLAASNPLKNFEEDYLSQLSLDNKSFWEQVIMYYFYIRSCKLYPFQTFQVYKKTDFEKLRYKGAVYITTIYHRIDNIIRKISNDKY